MRKLLVTGLAALAFAVATPAHAAPAAVAGVSRPAADGAYWMSKTLQTMTHPRQVGSGADKYWVVERRLNVEWFSRDGHSWHSYRPLGAQPKSAADRAAWKRDGSPRKWSYRTEGMLVKLSMDPEKGTVFAGRGSPGFIVGYTKLTFQELQDAPTDPAALKTWLNKLYSSPDEPEKDMSNAHGAYLGLMERLPVPKGVRAAAYQVLSTMTGVSVKDAGKGRTRLTYRSQDAKYKVRHAWTIDTTSMLVVSTDLDTVYQGEQLLAKTWTTEVKSGWTDEKPAVPDAF
jgi:hypothetical protein